MLRSRQGRNAARTICANDLEFTAVRCRVDPPAGARAEANPCGAGRSATVPGGADSRGVDRLAFLGSRAEEARAAGWAVES
jgi:hypothetical protein